MKTMPRRVIGNLHRRPSRYREDPDLAATGSFTYEGDPIAIGRKERLPFNRCVFCQLTNVPTGGWRQPDIPPPSEGERGSIRREGRIRNKSDRILRMDAGLRCDKKKD